MKRTLATPNRPEPIRKERTLLFARLPPGQVSEASSLLRCVEGLDVVPRPENLAIDIGYDLHEHSLEELEGALQHKGFHLDSSLLNKLRRALIYYVEETQLHNFGAPERLLKKSQHEAYTQAWERHLHGDHDDTPPEWREYK